MMKYFKKHWPLIGIGTLLIVVSVYFIKSKTEIFQELNLLEVVSEEGLKLENIHYAQENPDDGLKWSLDAKEAGFSNERQLISFRDFRLKLEAENRPTIELEGKRGEYDKNSGEIKLHGELKGYTGNGYEIITEQISYKQKEGCLETEKLVKIIGPFFSISGHGLHLDLRMENLKINSNVTTLIRKGALAL
jgi:LPS export ABC transporter protein LptC